MEVFLRKAIKKDSKEIAKVLMLGYSIESIEEGIQVFENEKSKGWNFIVAEIEGKVIGLVSWAMKGLPRHGLIELDRIAVLPEFRGKGISKKLFDAVELNAKPFFESNKGKLRKLFLFTHEDNLRAISFYKKMGMQEDALLKDHYYNGRNELVLRKFYD
jgi:ribosomal-protein-alanine N-acetyltransferase